MICIIHSSFRLQFDDEYQLVRGQWQGTHTDDFRAVMGALGQFMAEKQATRCLLDLRGLPDISFDDQAWLATYWLPKVAAHPVRQVALIFSPTLLYNQLVVENLLWHGRAFLQFEAQFFTDQIEALDWLTEASPRIDDIEQEWQLVYAAQGKQRPRFNLLQWRNALLCQTGSRAAVEQLLNNNA